MGKDFQFGHLPRSTFFHFPKWGGGFFNNFGKRAIFLAFFEIFSHFLCPTCSSELDLPAEFGILKIGQHLVLQMLKERSSSGNFSTTRISPKNEISQKATF